MTILLKNQTLHLHPNKAIFWENKKILFIADLHLGKAAHFRKKGIAAPPALFEQNIQNLRQLITHFHPVRVLILGDLFHSTLNIIWNKFEAFLLQFSEVSFELVKGNHDILPEQVYADSILTLHQPPIIIEPFILSHYPLETVPEGLYNLYGHLHPGVLLEGMGKQLLKLPCFYLEPTQAVLPAFGAFTGLALVQPQKGDRVFVVLEDEVLEM
ncbi:ligase-associated DNA damage response endonuclease PdeM [Neolewinella persica]|uniref:ligase-associated DNA damage response endonuclease PdeM n=1 Tax=Neolewinella persica TaxID=70998 RepID=UPI000382C71D|nr:ligase-associated DNA damage response endonuclease PdeM [Neolewinella persica]